MDLVPNVWQGNVQWRLKSTLLRLRMRVCGFLTQNTDAFRDPGNVSWIVEGGYPVASRRLSLPTSPVVGASGCQEFVLPTVSSGCSHTH